MKEKLDMEKEIRIEEEELQTEANMLLFELY